jgi:hypothetical protein
MTSGIKDNFAAFRTFGCRVWVRPTTKRSAKFKVNSRKGIFIGFVPNTTQNILWYDVDSQLVKIAKHVQFDEGMNDLPIDSIPPNVQYLLRVQEGQPFPAEPHHTDAIQFTLTNNPFETVITKTFTVRCKQQNFGLSLATDILYHRAYVRHIGLHSTIAKGYSSMKAANNALRGAYLLSINGMKVFSVADVLSAFTGLRNQELPHFSITFAPERALTSKQLQKALIEHDLFRPNEPEDEHTPTLRTADIRAIAALRFPDIDFSPEALPTEEIHLAVHALSSTLITTEEQALGAFTRRKLQTLSTWDIWRAGEHKQLDQMEALGMYGRPRKAPPGAIILRLHWQYQIRRSGERRARNCCDGSPRAAPTLHAIASTYSSCVDQPIQRLFYALSARMNYRVYGGDAQDAFAHSPGPSVPTFVHIDDAYADWYYNKYGVKLDRSFVLPVLRALQGHPESGRLWEKHINSILSHPELGFVHTTHDRTIYISSIRSENILLLRQVDDFSIACSDESIAKDIYDIIGRRLQLPNETSPPFKYLGLQSEFNGVDIEQSSTHIAISCHSYISRLLKSHGWDNPSPRESTTDHRVAPLPMDAVDRIYDCDLGPDEGTPAHLQLEQKQGFSYRRLLGELLFAYICARPDIGYSVTTLSKFGMCPAPLHYGYLKNIAKYLRRTIHWKIYYTKSRPDPSLTVSSLIPVP